MPRKKQPAKAPAPGFLGTVIRVFTAGMLAFAAAGAAGYATVYYMVKTPESQAPDLLTLPLEEAAVQASEQGFSVRIGSYESSAILEAGQVVAQRPAPEAWVKEGATIILTVAE